jgi:hypothetical protein
MNYNPCSYRDYDKFMKGHGYTKKLTLTLLKYIKPPRTTTERERIETVEILEKEETL